MLADSMKYSEIINIVKSKADQGFAKVSITKPTNHLMLQILLELKGFVVTYTKSDDMIIDWSTPPFEARDAWYISNTVWRGGRES